MTPAKQSIIFQASKLGDIPYLLDEFKWAQQLLQQGIVPKHVYGISGGCLVALAYTLNIAAQQDPEHWRSLYHALDDFVRFLQQARSRDLRVRCANPKTGVYCLNPLRRWIANYLRAHTGRDDWRFSELPTTLYLCAIDRDGILTLFGPPNVSLQFQYQFVHVGPPQDAAILDALVAGLSTLLSTTPAMVNGEWYRDCRPPIPDAGALIVDLEKCDPDTILRHKPYTPIRRWKHNLITSSFIMHSYHERNQPILVAYYLDLLRRHRELEKAVSQLAFGKKTFTAPRLLHVNLPYIGSTEAFTNMRQSTENKEQLMDKFRDLLNGQLDNFPYHQPANILYGAGGFSGILGGLVTTRAVDKLFDQNGGEIKQVYGVSAGVLNGFFHAVQIAARQHPDIYRPAAHNALADLENFIATITMSKFARINCNPFNIYKGIANLNPLKHFLEERLAAYTGTQHPSQIRFDDIGLPLTVSATRRDGFTEFFGMSNPKRSMQFAWHNIEVLNIRIVDAILAGWSMDTYIQPMVIDDKEYRDGGGAFYDIGMFIACMDSQLTNFINIHLDEPDGHSYNLPERPNLMRILFDTHNYTFPEERRRMFLLTNLLFTHYQLRTEYQTRINELPPGSKQYSPLPPDFRQEWQTAYTPDEVNK